MNHFLPRQHPINDQPAFDKNCLVGANDPIRINLGCITFGNYLEDDIDQRQWGGIVKSDQPREPWG
jgi:hypothetical protein